MTCTIVSTGEELQSICKNEAEKPISSIKETVFEQIQMLCGQGFDCFYTNCEYGIPLWAAETVLMLRQFNPITLHIVIPYEEQAVNWAEDVRDRYYNIHRLADRVELVCTRFQEDCYRLAEQRMIAQSDLILIFGQECVLPDVRAMAENNGIPIIFCRIE